MVNDDDDDGDDDDKHSFEQELEGVWGSIMTVCHVDVSRDIPQNQGDNVENRRFNQVYPVKFQYWNDEYWPGNQDETPNKGALEDDTLSGGGRSRPFILE